jgi:hypothetical protein
MLWKHFWLKYYLMMIYQMQELLSIRDPEAVIINGEQEQVLSGCQFTVNGILTIRKKRNSFSRKS